MTREVLIILPNGRTQSADLKSDRWTVGRSTDNDFGFPEDSGLSRQHLAFENENGTWIVRDLGSKNGTYVNEHLIQSKHRLSPGDKITASLLTVVFEPQPAKVPQVSIVFDRTRTDLGPAETLSTSLNDVISSQTISAKPAPRNFGTLENSVGRVSAGRQRIIAGQAVAGTVRSDS